MDHDVQPTSAVRVVKLTPPGSASSILLARGLPALQNEPESAHGLHLMVDDIDARVSSSNGVSRPVSPKRGGDLLRRPLLRCSRRA